MISMTLVVMQSPSLTYYRKEADYCRMSPEIITISFSVLIILCSEVHVNRIMYEAMRTGGNRERMLKVG